MITQTAARENQGVYVFSDLGLIQLPVEYTSCDFWLLFKYEYSQDKNNFTLEYYQSDSYMDYRVY